MLDPDTLVSAVVAALQANGDFVALLGGSTYITGYSEQYPNSSDFAQTLMTLNPPSALVRWRGTRCGRQARFSAFQAIMHDLSVYLRPLGAAAPVWRALREGVLNTTGQKFKLSQIHTELHPVEAMACIPRSITVAQTSFLDFLEVQFTVSERGIDD